MLVNQVTKQRLDNGDISIRIPLTLHKKGGRKMVLVPTGVHTKHPHQADHTPHQKTQHNLPLLNALVRAHQWKQQLTKGQYASLREISEANGMQRRYVWQIFQLNFLAPAIKAAILDGVQPRHLRLSDCRNGVPMLWVAQQEKWGIAVTDPLHCHKNNSSPE